MARRIALALLVAASCTDRTSTPTECEEGESVLASNRCNTCDCAGGHWEISDIGCGTALPTGQTVSCFDGGVADVDPDAPGVQVSCSVGRVTENAAGGVDEVEIPECVLVGEEPTWPAPEDDACWIAHTDDVSAACVEHRGELLALEIELLLRPSFTWTGTSLWASCASPLPRCPGWPADDW